MINIPLELYGLEEGKNRTDGKSLEDDRNQGGCNWWKTLSSYLVKMCSLNKWTLGVWIFRAKNNLKLEILQNTRTKPEYIKDITKKGSRGKTNEVMKAQANSFLELIYVCKQAAWWIFRQREPIFLYTKLDKL